MKVTSEKTWIFILIMLDIYMLYFNNSNIIIIISISKNLL